MRWIPAAVVVLMVMSSPVMASSGQGSSSSAGWELKRKNDDPRDGFALYTRPHPGSAYADYRLEIAIDGGKDEVIAALEHNMLDPETYPDGFQRTLLRRDRSVLITYDYIEVPLLTDRDVVVRTEVVRGAAPGQPSIRWHSIEGEGPPPGNGVVRMPASQGTWTLATNANATLAVYESHVDLGGSLPPAMVERRMPAQMAKLAEDLRRTLREQRVARASR